MNELSGTLTNTLMVYHWAPGWTALTNNHANGMDGPNFAYAQGEVYDFSPFLLGENTETPTAIDLDGFAARGNRIGVLPWITALAVLGLIGAGGFFWSRRQRR